MKTFKQVLIGEHFEIPSGIVGCDDTFVKLKHNKAKHTQTKSIHHFTDNSTVWELFNDNPGRVE